jgi:hypothetical protein
MTEDQYNDFAIESQDIALKIGGLVQNRTFGVGIMALQVSLKAIIECADPHDRPLILAGIMLFLTANTEEDLNPIVH